MSGRTRTGRDTQPVPLLARDSARIAMIDPMGDAGIGAFTHELANGIAAHGVRVDVFTTRRPFAGALSQRDYRLIPFFGDTSRSVEERVRTPYVAAQVAPCEAGCESVLDVYFDLLHTREARCTRGAPAAASSAESHAPAQLSHAEDLRAFAHALAAAGYAAAWTQWPDLGAGGAAFWPACRASGLPVVHTVHNVFPHERRAGDHAAHVPVYAAAQALIVHSRHASQTLSSAYPGTAPRIVESRHGMHSIYPRRTAARSRVRARLRLDDDATRALLFFGGVRPYKNLDRILEAMAARRDERLVLVVAGWEWGYGPSADALARTRELVCRLQLQDVVRLLPGPFGVPQSSELFEAADAVVLPYIEGYGSGVLLQAMAFNKHVIVSDAGGMPEYLAGYPRHTLLADVSRDGLVAGLDAFVATPVERSAEPIAVEHLAWPAVAGRLLDDLAVLL